MKTCPVCEEEFTPQFNSLQKACDTPCAIIYARNQAQTKKAKSADKAHAKRKKEFRVNDVPAQHKLTQPRFNLMRRLQEEAYYLRYGKRPECISCGGYPGIFYGGHFKAVGSHSEHRYEPKNVHLQCFPCNNYKSGNSEGYIKGLARRYGDREAFLIIDKLEQRKVRKWTGEELVAMRKQFNATIRELEEELND